MNSYVAVALHAPADDGSVEHAERRKQGGGAPVLACAGAERVKK